jgi:hypothetical protein
LADIHSQQLLDMGLTTLLDMGLTRMWMWAGGEAAGTALAEAIFGKINPSGRMPYSVVPSVAQLPPYEDMDLTKGRTYRYYGTTNLTKTAAPLWLFGDGLSCVPIPTTIRHPDAFCTCRDCAACTWIDVGAGRRYTNFSYSPLILSSASVPQCGNVSVTVTVTNSGDVAGSEVAQIYVTNPTRTMPSQRQNNQQDLDSAQQNFDTVRPRSLRAVPAHTWLWDCLWLAALKPLFSAVLRRGLLRRCGRSGSLRVSSVWQTSRQARPRR